MRHHQPIACGNRGISAQILAENKWTLFWESESVLRRGGELRGVESEEGWRVKRGGE